MATEPMSRIKVVISEREMLRWPHQHSLREFTICRTLKERGIPLKGVNQLNGVLAGKLTIWSELDLNEEEEHHFEWFGPTRASPPIRTTREDIPGDEDDEL
mgnify:CR=1 FL=1